MRIQAISQARSAALLLSERARWHVGVLQEELLDTGADLTPLQIAAVHSELARVQAELDVVVALLPSITALNPTA